MIIVKHFQLVNGNRKERKFRQFKKFDSMAELEKERKRLMNLHKSDIDFTPVIDTGDDNPPDEFIQTLFI